MKLKIRTIERVRFNTRAKWLILGTALAILSLLVAACGDNTATTVPPTVAPTAAPAATTASATTAAMTTAAMTSAAATTSAATTAAMTTSAPTTAAMTTAATTASVTTAASSGSTSANTGTPKIVLSSPTATAGTTFTITGDGFPPNTWFTLQFGPGDTTRSTASLALTDGSGKFATQIIMVSYGDGSVLVPGSNTLKLVTEDGTVTATTTFTIVPAPATATPKA